MANDESNGTRVGAMMVAQISKLEQTSRSSSARFLSRVQTSADQGAGLWRLPQ